MEATALPAEPKPLAALSFKLLFSHSFHDGHVVFVTLIASLAFRR